MFSMYRKQYLTFGYLWRAGPVLAFAKATTGSTSVLVRTQSPNTSTGCVLNMLLEQLQKVATATF